MPKPSGGSYAALEDPLLLAGARAAESCDGPARGTAGVGVVKGRVDDIGRSTEQREHGGQMQGRSQLINRIYKAGCSACWQILSPDALGHAGRVLRKFGQTLKG